MKYEKSLLGLLFVIAVGIWIVVFQIAGVTNGRIETSTTGAVAITYSVTPIPVKIVNDSLVVVNKER